MHKLDLSVLACHIFHELTSTVNTIRFWFGLRVLPKDIRNFTTIILSKMSDDIEKMDADKRSKIIGIKVDFDFRD